MRNSLLDIELDGLPPTVNCMYNGTRGWRYLTAETREFQERAIAILKSAWNNRPPYEGAAALFLTFYKRDRRVWDVDNHIKPVQDCLEKAGIILNDNQIELVQGRKLYGKKLATRLTLRECTLN